MPLLEKRRRPLTGGGTLDPRIECAIAYMERNLQRRLPMRVLAQKVNLSNRQFFRLFRAESGFSPALISSCGCSKQRGSWSRLFSASNKSRQVTVWTRAISCAISGVRMAPRRPCTALPLSVSGRWLNPRYPQEVAQTANQWRKWPMDSPCPEFPHRPTLPLLEFRNDLKVFCRKECLP